MKATFDLPDDLMIAAKKRAAEARRPMRELVERGLRAQLRPAPATRARASRARATIRWSPFQGSSRRGWTSRTVRRCTTR